MRYIKAIKAIIFYTLVVCLLAGCAADGQSVGSESVGTTENGSASSSENNSESATPVTYEDEKFYVLDKNIYSWNTEVQYEDVSYQIESIEFTQQLGDHKKDEVNYLTDEVDEEGNLLNDNYFAWIKLKFKNLSQRKQELFLNFPFASIVQEDGKNRAFEFAAEAVYINPRQASTSELAFQYYLEAGEEQEVELGYEIHKDTVEGDLCYLVGTSDANLDASENCFLNVEEFWDAK